MKRKILLLVLYISKACCLFVLSRRLTKGDLRILCYHGAASEDEHKFNACLFISGPTFKQRMAYLSRAGYPVIELGEALRKQKDGCLDPCTTVITVDDGWYGTYRIMAPALSDFGFPATLYIASYYIEKETQVFNVAANYVLWKARDQILDLSEVSDKLSGRYNIADIGQRDEAYAALNTLGESLAATARQDLFRRLCTVLKLDWKKIEAQRIVAFMTKDEARQLRSMGVNIQLHTHRHRFRFEQFEQSKREIDENRQALSALSDRPLVHFCYPSGYYNDSQIDHLCRLGVESATTVKPGFNTKETPRYELRRFLDSEAITNIEFEAEMSGFFELIRRRAVAYP